MSDLPQEIVPVEPTVTAPAELEYAGFWRRVTAHLIDAIVMGLALFAIVLLTFGDNSLYLMTLIVPGALSIVYQLYLTSKYGATLGKIAMDVKIMRQDGGPIGFTHANLRYLPYSIFGVIAVLGNIEALNNVPIPSIFFEHTWTDRGKILQHYQPAWAALTTVASFLFVLVDVVALLVSKQKLSMYDRIGGTMVIKAKSDTQEAQAQS
jgi:uncharacterized RDD family membrane protein YckC